MGNRSNVKLDIVSVYRIRNTRTNSLKYRRTLKGTMRAVAWAMIWDRYEGFTEIPDFKEFGGRRYETKRPAGYECDCQNTGDFPEWHSCPLHDRHDGYYKRLQRRLSVYLINKYQALPPDFKDEIQFENRENDPYYEWPDPQYD